MNTTVKISLIVVYLLCAAVLNAQDASPTRDRYRTYFAGADLMASPDKDSNVIGDVPGDVTFSPLAQESYWIKVKYKGQTGWISTAGCERLMAAPSADLDIVHRGYKVVDGKYRYYFGLTNRGTEPYRGDFTVRLYSGTQEVPLRGVGSIGWSAPHMYTTDEGGTRGYPLDPEDVIKPAQMRNYYLIADSLATRYVFDTAQGKKEGKIGKRLSDE